MRTCKSVRCTAFTAPRFWFNLDVKMAREAPIENVGRNMKSWWIKSQGGQLALDARDVPVPKPGPGEVVVRVCAAALNRGEFNPRYLADGGEKIGGHEAAGEVSAIGAGVAAVKAGDRVMGRARGGFSEFAVMPAYEAMPVPACLNWEQAAGVPLVFLVTYDMLIRHGRLQAGEWLLATAVSSGVGVACMQTAQLLGAKVIGTSGSQDKLNRLQKAGLDVGIATRNPDFAERVKEVTGGKGANVIVNSIGGSVFGECLRSLAYQGRFATVSTVDEVTKCEIDVAQLHANRWELFGASNRFTPQDQREQAVRGFSRDVLPGFGDGRIVPLIDSVYDFAQLPAARDRMLSNAQVGKIILRAPA